MRRAGQERSDRGKLTGRKVALMFVAFFGVVIGVNVILMVNAIGTFSGLVVPNSYVASQSFDENRAAQEALGWNVSIGYEDEQFRISLRDEVGNVVRPPELQVVIGRVTTEAADSQPDLVETPEGYAAAIALDPGNWRVDVRAKAVNGTDFLQYRSLFVSAGGS